MRSVLHLFIGFCILFLVSSCQPKEAPVPENVTPIDTLTVMECIEEDNVLTAVTNIGMLNFRLLDGRPAGFHFDLLDDFSESLGLDLNLSVNDDILECLYLLKKHKVDVFAGTFDTLIADSSLLFIPIELPAKTGKNFAWVLLKHNADSSLLSSIQLWLDDFQESQMRRTFYRYFHNGKIRNDSSFLTTNHISRYDDLIRAEAQKNGWDWRLLASIIYQESKFKPHLLNEKGAFGLMQLMPVTMNKYGIDYNSSVEEQLKAGIKVLNHFSQELPESISDSAERINFILASYNAGMGHVLEARHRAEKHGKDPDLWIDNVEYYTPKQTFFFVREITKRYSYYKDLIE